MVLSIAHMSMVIFPIIFNIFHISGVKKPVKTKKNILEPRLVYRCVETASLMGCDGLRWAEDLTWLASMVPADRGDGDAATGMGPGLLGIF